MSTWTIRLSSNACFKWAGMNCSHQHVCPTCHIPLLTGERPGFCCGPNGSWYHNVPALPPLPPEYDVFLHDPHISFLSRKLNLLFALAAIETSILFIRCRGPQGHFSIQGRIFHCLHAEHKDSPVHWIIYNGFSLQSPPHLGYAHAIPNLWIESVRAALLRSNPFIRDLCILGDLDPQTCPEAHVVLSDTGTYYSELAAIISYNNSVHSDIQPYRLIVARTDNQNVGISTTSRFWEPLSYPLFFPEGTLGWGIPHMDPTMPHVDVSVTSLFSKPETTQIWHYHAFLLCEDCFSIFG